MTVTLQQLYARRLQLTRELVSVTGMIQTLEKLNTGVATKRVHHVDGCGLVRNQMKRTRNWDLVDCIVCHKVRVKKRPPFRSPQQGKDWAEVVR